MAPASGSFRARRHKNHPAASSHGKNHPCGVSVRNDGAQISEYAELTKCAGRQKAPEGAKIFSAVMRLSTHLELIQVGADE